MSFAIASRLPDITVLNGSTFASSGFALTSAGTRSRQYITCEYIGCSTHSVPSWSNVAMRSAGGTNFGLPCVVVVCTNSTIAFLAGPSFQEGSGSVCASACAPKASAAPSASMRANMKDKLGFTGHPPDSKAADAPTGAPGTKKTPIVIAQSLGCPPFSARSRPKSCFAPLALAIRVRT